MGDQPANRLGMLGLIQLLDGFELRLDPLDGLFSLLLVLLLLLGVANEDEALPRFPVAYDDSLTSTLWVTVW